MKMLSTRVSRFALACFGVSAFARPARALDPGPSPLDMPDEPTSSRFAPAEPALSAPSAPVAEGKALAEPAPAERAPNYSFWQAQLGVRALYITDAGYDPFSSDNSFVMSSIAITRTLWQQDRFSFAPGIFWDHGAQSSMARDDPSSLDVHRLGMGLEGRYHLTEGLYGLVRFTPCLLHESARLEDAGTRLSLTYSQWLASFDVEAGAALRLPRLGKVPIRLWVIGEGGYAWAQHSRIVLTPEDAANGPATGPLTLGDLALRGGAFRIALAAAY